VTYALDRQLLPYFKKGEVSLFTDFLMVDYEDFRDVRKSAAPGSEPLYELESTVIRAYISLWY
jgi:hypothetical protein